MTRRTGPGRIRILALPAYLRTKQNPFTGLLYDEVRKLDIEVEDWTWWRALWRPCDIWHMHHPDTVLYPRRRWQSTIETVLMRLLLTAAKLRGIKVLWTVHDIGSHDGLYPFLEKWFWKYFPPKVDAVISLTETGRDMARRTWPVIGDKPAFVAPHGHFRDIYPNTLSKSEARAQLGIDRDRPMILHFGLIRPYKSVPDLVDAFRALGHPEATLMVAGKVWDPAVGEAIRERSGGFPGIDLRFGWIPFEETQVYLNACDIVVLPYRRILNSGAALLALGFDRPVLVPNMGAMPELRARFGSDWVRLFEGEIGPGDVAAAIDWSKEPRAEGVNWEGLDWATLAHRHREIYERVLGDCRSPANPPVATKTGDA